jgi:hypothetical protein
MKAFLKEYGLPLLILVAFLVIAELTEWTSLLFIPLALIVGLVFKPRHVWIPWLAVVLVLWIAYGLLWLTGNWPWPDPTRGETYSSFALEVVLFSAVGVLLPLWIGRLLRWVVELGSAAMQS